ncbi:MAG: ATP-binding protein, partial [Planctomycetota bacterium]
TEHKKLWSHLIQSEKMSALGLLVAGIAHEINNPLSVVMGYTQSLLKKTPEKNQFELVKIHKNAQRAVNIVKHLLSFTRCENIAKKHTDIHEVIEESFALFTQELKLRNIRLVKKYNRLPLVVNGEINQIQQVFVNIISNALDALMSQKNTERVLSVKTVKDGNLAKVILEDTGCGIPDREVKRIFDPFFTTKEVGKGTGLGLSICYKIIQNHGGDIHVTSQLGKGTAFTIELPLTSIKRLQNMGRHPLDTEKVDNAHPTVKTRGVRKKDRREPRIHP